uniref:Uncharacterized protein n=1 Tax=Oryza meridionalis TaxID=40149 RepID=A0A0E0EXR6_9ORYZ
MSWKGPISSCRCSIPILSNLQIHRRRPPAALRPSTPKFQREPHALFRDATTGRNTDTEEGREREREIEFDFYAQNPSKLPRPARVSRTFQKLPTPHPPPPGRACLDRAGEATLAARR